jgi:hypothetical protein
MAIECTRILPIPKLKGKTILIKYVNIVGKTGDDISPMKL